MAAPLLAPFAPILPVIKILALGSLKFIGIGIGAAFAPVMTANFIVGIAAGTPLKYAKFRQKKGHFSPEELALIEQANTLVAESLENPSKHLTRPEAQEFLKEILLATFVGMKQSVISLPAQIVEFSKSMIAMIKKPFSSNDK